MSVSWHSIYLADGGLRNTAYFSVQDQHILLPCPVPNLAACCNPFLHVQPALFSYLQLPYLKFQFPHSAGPPMTAHCKFSSWFWLEPVIPTWQSSTFTLPSVSLCCWVLPFRHSPFSSMLLVISPDSSTGWSPSGAACLISVFCPVWIRPVRPFSPVQHGSLSGCLLPFPQPSISQSAVGS